MSIAFRFKGNRTGEFYSGVPAKSLTQGEYDALDTDLRKLVREGDLYEAVQQDAPKNHDKPAASKAEDRKGAD